MLDEPNPDLVIPEAATPSLEKDESAGPSVLKDESLGNTGTAATITPPIFGK